MRYVIGLIVIALVAGAAFILVGRDDNQDGSTNPPPATNQTTDNRSTGGDNTQPVETSSVTISNLTFNPSDISVKKGTKVTWTNNDSVAHTVEFDSTNVQDSGTLNNGDTYSLTFNKEGTFDYICGLHPQMRGTVIVTE